MIQALIFLVGLAAGSFLNVVLWRVGRKKSIALARSECPDCHHQLGPADLFPVLSFLGLKGRCRYCQVKISWQYPAVELTAGLGFLFIFNRVANTWEAVFISGFFWVGILIFVYDLKHLIIPDSFVAMGLVWVLGFMFILKSDDIFSRILMALGLFLFFFSMYFFSQGAWVGGGDAKLGFLVGLWLGWPLGVLALFLAYIFGAAVGLGLLVFKKAGLKTQLAFGPFLVFGSMLAYFYGYQIINWYINLF